MGTAAVGHGSGQGTQTRGRGAGGTGGCSHLLFSASSARFMAAPEAAGNTGMALRSVPGDMDTQPVAPRDEPVPAMHHCASPSRSPRRPASPSRSLPLRHRAGTQLLPSLRPAGSCPPCLHPRKRRLRTGTPNRRQRRGTRGHGGAEGGRGIWLRRSGRESVCSTHAEGERDGCVRTMPASARAGARFGRRRRGRSRPPDPAKRLAVAARRWARKGPFSLQRQREPRLFTYRQAELRCHLGRQPGSAADQSLQDWTARRKEKKRELQRGEREPPHPARLLPPRGGTRLRPREHGPPSRRDGRLLVIKMRAVHVPVEPGRVPGKTACPRHGAGWRGPGDPRYLLG